MTKYKKHTIEVTQKHIDEGVPTSCTDCAISLAFKDSLLKTLNVKNFNNCLVRTEMSNGEVSLSYSHDGSIFGVNLKEYVDDFTSNLQYKIDAFVKEYDNNFIPRGYSESTIPKDKFIPKHCVPWTFDVRLPV